jgi:glyoxylase-like metal-dependent hydrolase (beta-lactamase superfamily II)
MMTQPVSASDDHVEPGGPAIELVDGWLTIRKRSVSDHDNNVYALICSRTRQALVVDAADQAPAIVALVDGCDVTAVVQTHGHWDHVRAWSALREGQGWPIWGHAGDLELYPAAPDRLLVDGEELAVGALSVRVIHLPGHTEGSLVLHVRGETRDWLLTGDTLFPGGPGSTAGDLARHARVMDGIEARLFLPYDDRTRVLPGHGDGTTLGAERASLPAWRARGW